jgi:hypothetical protein
MQKAGWIVALAGVLTGACGGGGGLGKPIAVFPSASDLAEVAEQPVAPDVPLSTLEVERWQLQGPIPSPGAEYASASRFDEILKEKVAKRGGQVVLSSALACAARETARFYVELGAYPTEALQQYLVARCGGTLASPRLFTFGGDLPDSVTEEQVLGEFAEKFPAALEGQLPKGAGVVGLGYVRGKGRASIVVYSGEPRARLQGFSPLVSGNHAVLEGEAPRDAVFGLALVNQGPSSVELCDADRAVRPPRFRFTCPVLEADAQARIEIATRKEGQVLLNTELSVLVRRDESAGMVYEPAQYGSPETSKDTSAFGRDLLEGLNGVRRSAGMRTLTLETEQSKSNTRLAPHWFQASFTGDDERAQLVALGLLAGWDVNGTIRNGGIYAGFSPTTRSAGRFLSRAMESPLARWVLLEPDIAKVAIGANGFGPSGVLTVLTTYSFFESKDHSADEKAVFEELVRVRAARNLPAPKRTPKPKALASALSEIATNRATIGDAMQEVVETVSTTEQRSIGGYMVETSDLKQLIWSEDLLQNGPLEVSIGVTHYKAEGAAWGQYAILIVSRQDTAPAAKTARRSANGRGAF